MIEFFTFIVFAIYIVIALSGAIFIGNKLYHIPNHRFMLALSCYAAMMGLWGGELAGYLYDIKKEYRDEAPCVPEE